MKKERRKRTNEGCPMKKVDGRDGEKKGIRKRQ